RLRNIAYDRDEHNFTDADRTSILFTDNKIFHHSILRMNYTTYDLRHKQDTINPCTCADIMVLSHEDEKTHPYWYARVIGIFHVNVEYREDDTRRYSEPIRMDFLFVQWFRRDSLPAGWSAKQLQCLEFFDQDSPDAYRFLDLDSVVRGIHLIPSFHHCTDPQDLDSDIYTIYSFVDRDIFMQFCGGRIGHKATRDWDEILQLKQHGAEEAEAEEGDDAPDAAEEEEEWEDIEDDLDDVDKSDDEEEDDEDDEDRVIAGEGEELDDDILAEEGYGAL
ncbi:hypothetical protein BDR06DRAFT_899875, partial [Suillus hirtellus]